MTEVADDWYDGARAILLKVGGFVQLTDEDRETARKLYEDTQFARGGLIEMTDENKVRLLQGLGRA